MTIPEIACMLKVTPGTIRNWRRQYEDFPKPIGTIEKHPYAGPYKLKTKANDFDREEVLQWYKEVKSK